MSGLLPILDGRRWGYVDPTGRRIIEPVFKAAMPFAEGLAAVRQKKRYGFIDDAGTEVIPERFDKVVRFAEGLAVVHHKRAGKWRWGYADRSGDWLLKPELLAAYDFSCGLARVQFPDATWGFIDPTMTKRFEMSRWSGGFNENRAPTRDDDSGLYGYRGKDGSWKIAPRFERAGAFHDGLAEVSSGGCVAFVDPNGTVAIQTDVPSPTHEPTCFDEGLAPVFDLRVGNYGYLDREGRYAIEPRYGVARAFCGGIAPAGPTTQDQGYIDTRGDYVIKPVLWTAWSFKDGIAKVFPDPSRPTAFGYIDAGGQWIWQPSKAFHSRFDDLPS
ncbi:MAG: WG repeat-containing protein [Deltaproteobacteria bacterium]|nr:WG repeat-containing protein [Deltaproteobacteria bacterium]